MRVVRGVQMADISVGSSMASVPIDDQCPMQHYRRGLSLPPPLLQLLGAKRANKTTPNVMDF